MKKIWPLGGGGGSGPQAELCTRPRSRMDEVMSGCGIWWVWYLVSLHETSRVKKKNKALSKAKGCDPRVCRNAACQRALDVSNVPASSLPKDKAGTSAIKRLLTCHVSAHLCASFTSPSRDMPLLKEFKWLPLIDYGFASNEFNGDIDILTSKCHWCTVPSHDY